VTLDDQNPDVDLSVKAGFEYELRQCRREMRRMVAMIHSLDNPMEGLTFHPSSDPDDSSR